MTATRNVGGRVPAGADGPGAPAAAGEAADHQALADCAAGNPEALTRLAERHAAACLVVARQVLGDEQKAQDAVERTYLDLWRQASNQGPARSAIGPWLVMLTHRRAVDMVRRDRERGHPIDRLTNLAGDINAEAHRTTAAFGEHTVARLGQLPADQRQCLILAYWGGYAMSEIAASLDLPVETVKSSCRLALHTASLRLHEPGPRHRVAMASACWPDSP